MLSFYRLAQDKGVRHGHQSSIVQQSSNVQIIAVNLHFTNHVLLLNTILNKGVSKYNSPLNARYKRIRIIDGFL